MAHNDTTDLLDSVAVIGMSGRFPGARNVGELWDKLTSGQECVYFFSRDELVELGMEPALLNDPNLVGAAGVLDGIERFDAAFFGYTAAEAEIMDPEHRLFLECAWEALEHAGVNPETRGVRIGVYAGAGLLPSYIHQANGGPDLLKSRFYSVVTGNDKDHLAPRVAYKLDLRGPAITVQTACSTSLVAVHLACQSLLSGECDIALSGGASIRLRPGYVHEEGGILSPDGHCRAFDSEAAGTVPGSGIGVVVLKRLG
ncbi:MAG TPA: polyketide synthase, partial [Blastocatellia bacterium]|nr:polyketide synthase [Blastocatellia bacterium]